MVAGAPRSPVAEPAARRPAATPASPMVALVAGGRLPLAFIALGGAALLVAGLWLALEPTLAIVPHVHPHTIGLVHLWLPVGLLGLCVGTVYQMLPVIVGVSLRGERWAWAHLGLHGLAAGALPYGLATSRFAWAGLGGTAFALGAGSFAVVVWRTFLGGRRRDAIAWCFPLAATWLTLTTLAGTVMVVNRFAGWPGLSALAWLRAHAHLGLAGFFLSLLQGATFQLVPMFVLGTVRSPRRVGWGLALGQAGLVGLVVGLLGAQPWIAGGAAVVLAGGVACTAVELVAVWRSRRKRKGEPSLRGFLLGAWLLGGAAVLGVALATMRGAALFWPLASAYGSGIIVGALSLMILGMLGKIVPFLVWMRAYGGSVGRRTVPAAGTLVSVTWMHVWCWAHGTGAVVLTAAAVLGAEGVARVGAWLLLGGLAAHAVAMGAAARHLWQRREDPL